MPEQKYDLEKDLHNDAHIKRLMEDDTFAKEVYSALCNMRWVKVLPTSPDGLVQALIDSEEERIWSCSWRSAGRIVADLRKMYLIKCDKEVEGYVDWYCIGNEGHVTPRIEHEFRQLGWESLPWENYICV